MSPVTMTCAHCGAAFEAVRNDARFCSNRHRTAAGRAVTAARYAAEVRDLLFAQTAAVIAGDTAALADIDLRAARLFGIAP